MMFGRSLVVATLIVCAATAWGANHTNDSLDKVRENLRDGKAVLIDVREQDEWKRGHLKQATLVPLSKLRQAAKDPAALEQMTSQLPREQIIYCHCGSGVRVLTAAAILGKLGYDIRPLAEGFGDLVEAGFPAVMPE